MYLRVFQNIRNQTLTKFTLDVTCNIHTSQRRKYYSTTNEICDIRCKLNLAASKKMLGSKTEVLKEEQIPQQSKSALFIDKVQAESCS